MNAIFLADPARALAINCDVSANVSPHLHVRVHPFLLPVVT